MPNLMLRIAGKVRVGLNWIPNPIPLKRRLAIYLLTSRDPNYGSWVHDRWQVEDLLKVVDPSVLELMLLRNRGGSKTRDGTEAAVFLAYQTYQMMDWRRVIWYASGMSQLEQALEYFRQNRYVKECTSKKAILWNGNVIKIRPLSAKQAASPRGDDVFFDEEQDAEEKNYQKAVGTLVGGEGRKIHMGTTELDTVLEENYNRLKPKGFVLEHHVDECSWTTLEKELRNYEGFPQFVIDSQLFCKWVRAGGTVFENLEQGVFDVPKFYPRYYGLAPNPKSGHALVLARWLPDSKTIYIEKEYPKAWVEEFMANDAMNELYDYFSVPFTAEFNIKNLVDHIGTDSFAFARLLARELMGDGRYCEIEENHGEEFYKIFREVAPERARVKATTVPWTENSKHKRIYQMRSVHIVVNPDCEQTYKHLREAVWNPREPKARLLKTPEQHFLDGAIHACSWQDIPVIHTL